MYELSGSKCKRVLLFKAMFVLFCFSLQKTYSQQPDNDRQTPEVPWAEASRRQLPPGEPGEDYTPVVAPNATVAVSKIVDGIRVFHLTAAPVTHEVAPGLTVDVWGFNGTVPGPVLELTEGEKVRIYATNHLPTRTSVHWHGVLLPCGMDGAAGLTQPPIEPGQTFLYEFYFPEAGTFMYHSHVDSMTQEGMGLVGMIVVHERLPKENRPDRDFAVMLHEWSIQPDTRRPNVNAMDDFNILTMNGKVMPATEPLVARQGDTVWMRFGNLSAMNHHPVHLHGHAFKIIGTDGGWTEDRSKLTPETTVLVPVGAARVIEFVADNPGDWLFHCHMTHHTMNQMGHASPLMLGVDTEEVDEKIRELIPGYMSMGTAGMEDMTRTGMPLPENSIPMLGGKFQFGQTVMGGMANVLRVREGIESYDDPGPYEFPEGTVAQEATAEEMERDGIEVESPPQVDEIEKPMPHDHHMEHDQMKE